MPRTFRYMAYILLEMRYKINKFERPILSKIGTFINNLIFFILAYKVLEIEKKHFLKTQLQIL